MPFRKRSFLIPILLGLACLAALVILWPAPKASAQCGSQASSCKNCHEVQAQDPVNADGTGWHQSHAFGDFCYICHAGNNQSMDKATAHTGMVPPMSDVKAACQQCHPDDLQQRAQVYATTLGITPDGSGNAAGGSVAPSNDAPAAAESAAPAVEAAPAQPAAPSMVAGEGEVVDYNELYAGKSPVNWGNILLTVLIVLVAAGGGTFIYFNERKLRGITARPKAKAAPQASVLPQVPGYSLEVTALLPKIAKLNPVGLHALRRLLEDPEQANELLHSVSKLDPEMVRRIRSMDRESRALLLALSGD